MALFVILHVIAGLQNATGRSVYLDSRHGLDQWPGTERKPWKTLAPLRKLPLQPGDEILFARGSAFQGNLIIDSDGTAEAPIKIKSYGIGSKPRFTNPDYELSSGNAIRVNAKHVIIESLFFTRCPANPIDADIHSIGAVFLTTNANHCIVRDCEFSKTPVGVSVYGEHNLITSNWVHDNNAPIKPHWGPMGIVVCGSRNEISCNKFENYCAPSAEYGHDGGAIEINDRSLPKEAIIIHHNLSFRNQGFIEWVGQVKQDQFWIHHNVCMDYQSFLGLTGPCTNFRIEHNTVIRTLAHKHDDSEDVVFWNYDGPNTNINLINNIFVYDCRRVEPVFSRGGFLHSYNLFFRVDYRSIPREPNQFAYQRKYLGGGALLHAGDRLGDPRFVDFRHGDFHLRPDSPATARGTNLNYAIDPSGRHLSGKEHPSMGAYED
jgi:hypothetical protein